MLAILKKPPTKRKYKDPDDIIVTKWEEKTEVIDSKTVQTKRVGTKVNITKLVNETKKIVKQDSATAKISELADAILKETNKKV